MKKVIISFILLGAAVAGYSQTAYDALRFSENNYEGTARSVAMGNAFTALGGDLGSIAINPAGSAVAGYSQFAITPSLTFSTSTAQGEPYQNGSLLYFQKAMKSNVSRFNIPNLGFTFNYDTGRNTGLKSLTFGFVLSKTAGWNEDVYATGTNDMTSFMGQLAAEATEMGYLGSGLEGKEAYNNYPWKTAVGYQSGMISTFGGYDDQFVGASELIFFNPATGTDEIGLGGKLNQTYGRRVNGNKYDYLINVGANISDFLYLGANLGINALEYGYDEYFKEGAVNPYDFSIDFGNGNYACFEQMKYNYGYSASGSGFFAKFGFIVTPAMGLRIGGAIQTPTVTTIVERWQMSGSTTFSDNSFSGSAVSPEGEAKYKLRSPMRANLGIAYTLGTLGVISADYEMCNYGGMSFDGPSYDMDYFDEINADISSRFGTAHSFRAGIEVKPTTAFAVRGGYNISGNAEKYMYDGSPAAPVYTQNASFGLGYSSKKSFYADLAARRTFTADEFCMPYADYIYDAGNGQILDPAPEIRIHQSLWKVLLTIGWRF